MRYLDNLLGNANMRIILRFSIVTCLAMTISMLSISSADAQLVTAGELVVDLRGADLEGGASIWINQDNAGDTAGDFSTVGGGTLNVVPSISDSNRTVPFALYVAGSTANSVIAANVSPTSIIGNDNRSAEAWVYALTGSGAQSPVAWGNSGNDQDSSFNYSDGGNGMFNGWFNDGGWRFDQENDPITPTIKNEWVHVAWTYDGDFVRGYRNGVLTGEYDTVDSNESGQDLDTVDSPITVGSARGGGSNGFSGYIADVRVHTGLLSDANIMTNYLEGVAQPTGLACDFNDDGDCDSNDLATLKDNMFASGDSSMGDVNRDGFVDWLDWRLFKDDANRVVGSMGSALTANQQVPEPSTAVILGIAAALFAGVAGGQRRVRN